MSDHILEICQEVLAQDAQKEKLYSRLDDLIIGLSDLEVESILQNLRQTDIHDQLIRDRAKYEYDREVLLAKEIVEANNASPLGRFRSTEWYESAHRFENQVLAEYSPTNILMIGSGPFPSTMLSLSRDFPKAKLTCADRQGEACNLAIKVANILGCQGLRALRQDALLLEDLEQYDCILVGTVVGLSGDDKRTIVNHFLKQVPERTTLAFRTAVGSGKIIYPALAPGILQGRLLAHPPQKTWTTILRAGDT